MTDVLDIPQPETEETSEDLESLKIEIRPIPNRDGIKKFSDNLEYFSQAHILCPFVNSVTMKYETGLKQKDIEYLKSKGCNYDLSDNYTRGVPHPFWESHVVKMELRSSPVFLFPKKSLVDFIKWKYLLVNKYIYKSQDEMKSGNKPQATHFIYNEEIENNIKATRVQKKNELIRKISELSLQRKRDVVLILLGETTENKNEDYLTVRFDDIMSDAELTKKLTELLTEDAESISLSAFIKSAIYKNVLKRTKQGIFFYETNLGFDEEAVKEFLRDKLNQEIYITIKSKIG